MGYKFLACIIQNICVHMQISSNIGRSRQFANIATTNLSDTKISSIYIDNIKRTYTKYQSIWGEEDNVQTWAQSDYEMHKSSVYIMQNNIKCTYTNSAHIQICI